MSPALLGILAYVFIQLIVVFLVSRRARRATTETDFLLAGRRLGPGLATFTIFATWFGAETCIGAAGRVYAGGLSNSTSDPFGYTICLLLLGLVFAVPLWRRGLTTLADFYRQRYSAGVERVAALLLIPTSVMWAAAQVRALGQIVSASSAFDVELAIAVAAGAVVLYTVYGGLLANAVTDLMQGLMVMIGLVVVLVAALAAIGGIEAAVTAIDPQRLRIFGGPETPLLEIVERWAIPIFGSLLAQEVIAVVLASRTPQVARKAALFGGSLYFVFGLIPVAIGLIGLSLVPGLKESEQLLPTIARLHLTPILYVLFAGAIVSAILSTVSAALLAAAALTEHNLIARMVPDLSAATKVRVARVCVVVAGAVAYVLAVHAEGVYELVEQASAFGSSGIVTVAAIGLFTKFGNVRAGYAALFGGAGSWIMGHYVLSFPYPYLTSLVVAVAAYTLAALTEREPQTAIA